MTIVLSFLVRRLRPGDADALQTSPMPDRPQSVYPCRGNNHAALRDLQELVEQGVVRAAGTTKDRRYVRVGEGFEPAIRRIAP
jgi:hypothetical protein